MRRITFLLAILCSFAWQAVNAQSKQVTGQVTFIDDGLGMPGVAVVVKGTTFGTTTDIDGNYTIETKATDVLQFSFVGMITQEVLVGDKNVINVIMETESIGVEEVVVTALGIRREKKSLGYSVQSIGGEELNEVQETNFASSLSGKVTGVHVRMPNAMGGSANVLVRGSTSFLGDNQAMFVIDGVPIDNRNTNEDRLAANTPVDRQQNQGGGGYDYGNMAMDINPDDIESVSVLKGAAATALYGTRAANGVILITTKRGKKREGIGVTVNSGLMLSEINKKTGPQWQKEYGAGYGPFYEDPTGYFFYSDIDGDGVEDLITPTAEDASWGAKFDPNLMVIHWDALDPNAPNYGEKRPWVAGANDWTHMFRTGVKWNNSVAFEGGNDDGDFRFSYTNIDEEGILPNSSIRKNNVNFSSSYNLTEKLSVKANVNYSNTQGRGRFGTGYDDSNIMQSLGQWIQTNLDFARLDKNWIAADGTQRTWNMAYYNDLKPIFFNNPYWVRRKNYETDERNRIFGYTKLDYKFTDWLTFTGRVSIDTYSDVQEERIAVGSINTPYYSNFARFFEEVNTNLMLNFNKTVGDFSLLGMVGSNFRQGSLSTLLAQTVGGLVVPDLYTIGNSLAPSETLETATERDINSVFGSFSVGYKDMLYLDFTDRYDIASSLPTDNNEYNYFSVSTSIIVSELDGLKDLSFLSFGKIRANYAEVGKDTEAHNLFSTYTKNISWGSNALFSVNNILNNPDLKPERTESIELGLEARFFENRLGIDIAAYKTNSKDQIMPVAITTTSGYTSKYVNSGEIENKGLEISLNGTPIKTKDFSWDVTVNWYKNRSKVLSIFEGVDRIVLSSWGDLAISVTKGQPYGIITGTDFVYKNGKRTVDDNGFYIKTPGSNEVIGDITPDWNMGIMNQFSYKGITAKILFDIQQGGDVFSFNTRYGEATGLYKETVGLNAKGNPKRNLPEAVDANGNTLDWNADWVRRNADNTQYAGLDAKGNLTFTENTGGYLFPNTVYEDGTPNTTYVEAHRSGRAYYYGGGNPTSRYIFDASYVKLREVSLSYNLPKSIIDKTPLSNVVLSIVGRNLAILHKNTEHFDPEASLSSGNNQGIESGSYPTTRNIGFNLKLQF